MIRLIIDDKPVDSQCDNLQKLLKENNSLNHLQDQQFAVVVNENFIAKSEYTTTRLNHNDRIDIFKPIQGG